MVDPIIWKIDLVDAKAIEDALLNAGFRPIKTEITIRSRWRYERGTRTASVTIYRTGTVMAQGNDPNYAVDVLQQHGIAIKRREESLPTTMFL